VPVWAMDGRAKIASRRKSRKIRRVDFNMGVLQEGLDRAS